MPTIDFAFLFACIATHFRGFTMVRLEILRNTAVVLVRDTEGAGYQLADFDGDVFVSVTTGRLADLDAEFDYRVGRSKTMRPGRPETPRDFNYHWVREASKRATAEICNGLADCLENQPKIPVVRQLREFAAGQTGSNISDAMIDPLAKIRSLCETAEEVYELDRCGVKLPLR